MIMFGRRRAGECQRRDNCEPKRIIKENYDQKSAARFS
jgi:hypothetical protein